MLKQPGLSGPQGLLYPEERRISRVSISRVQKNMCGKDCHDVDMGPGHAGEDSQEKTYIRMCIEAGLVVQWPRVRRFRSIPLAAAL